ncbi:MULTISPECIES: helix-turn-helix domain-containing protein [unclassified Cellulosimicrobium]|uniref:helix-turn-helix domain-containing protein n=1 Tax=unclassified Cellulosimicrobium TaxID=2624466 RepID=UPI0016499709|nr:helix-turn-helix transcriptional regulator [Cellulosimicrobium sp. SH8]
MTTKTSKLTVIAKRGPLAAAIKKSGLSYRELQEKTGQSRSAINNLVRDGQRYAMDEERAKALASVLGEPVERLFAHKNGDPLGGVQ